MVAKVFSVATVGLDGRIIEIETDLSHSLPGITIVGLGDKAVEEAKDRIRSALKNSGWPLVPKRFTVNLVPADLPKKGTAYDLPIALSMLISGGQLETVPEKSLFLGELGLNGDVKPVPAVLATLEAAKRHGYESVFISEVSVRESQLIKGITIYPVSSLRQLVRHLLEEELIPPLQPRHKATPSPVIETDMADIFGQEAAKRALLIAIAGRHNVLLSGPPGAGKTLLARAAASLLPNLSLDEQIEVSKIHQLSTGTNEVVSTAPFRAPHHTASSVAITGGGSWPKPGEISLAHRGILYLDEVAEFPRSVLEVLRQPLEEGSVHVARAHGHLTFPARFMLIASQNPCPCGYAGDPQRVCSCSLNQINHYNQRLSGPLLDRFDMFVSVTRPNQDQLLHRRVGLSTTEMRAAIIQANEFKVKNRADCSKLYNSQLHSNELDQVCQLDSDAKELVTSAVSQLSLSARAYHSVLRVARTVADLDASQRVESRHLSEALQYRSHL